ncbi:MAG: glycosyl hydrolase family 28-related protein, partial [Bacteroidota bacterium]
MEVTRRQVCLCMFVMAGNLFPVCVAASAGASQTMPAAYNVVEFGAKADGRTKDTHSIQKAIETCSENGGGTVYFPPGTYITGSLHLRNRVALYLDHGATIKASTDQNDFDPYEELGFKNDADHETSFFHHSLIWGENVEHVAILGTGTIDGNRTKRGGPKPIALKRCQHVTIKDITIRNAPNYAISLLGTDYVNIDGVNILNGYCDGIDPDACRYVRIANCQIETWDDAIVPKASFSLGVRRAVEYLTVTNCILATNCNAFKLGTESGGGFRHITVSNCVMYSRATGRPPVSGIALESVDGGDIDGVTISNIAMANVQTPIFLRLGNRGRDMDKPIPGTLRNVFISNIVATGANQPCPIVGIPGH